MSKELAVIILGVVVGLFLIGLSTGSAVLMVSRDNFRRRSTVVRHAPIIRTNGRDIFVFQAGSDDVWYEDHDLAWGIAADVILRPNEPGWVDVGVGMVRAVDVSYWGVRTRSFPASQFRTSEEESAA